MRNLLKVMIFLLFLGVSVETYSQSLSDLWETEDYELDMDSDDFNFDSDRANSLLTDDNLRDTSRYDTSEQQNLISNFITNVSSYLNAVYGMITGDDD